jgi:hypothetical protein
MKEKNNNRCNSKHFTIFPEMTERKKIYYSKEAFNKKE